MPSPDERFVAHRRATATAGQSWALSATTRNSEVFVTPLDGSPGVDVSNSPVYDGWPTWSPDGRWIVFASNRAGIAYTGQIYAVRPDGRDLRPLSEGALSRVQPSFDAAGRQLFVYESIENAATEIGHVARFAVNFAE